MGDIELPQEYIIQRKNNIVEYNNEFHVQPSTQIQNKHTLYLGAMEVFFNNTERLRCHEGNNKIDDEFNGNKWYNYVKNIRRPIDVVNFQFITETDEENIEFKLRVSGSDKYVMCIKGDNHEDITILIDTNSVYKCESLKNGFHEIEIYPENELKKVQKLWYINIISKNKTYAVRSRWRPSAIHSKFVSTESPKFMTWVMGIKALNPIMSCYAPVTSPFGYYGFVLNKDGTVTKGINFSLWSFGMKEEKPPTHKLSRILAIGDPNSTFGHFDHEGTGVKIRNFNHVFQSNTSKEYTLALRMRDEPKYVYQDGQIYTYFAYYWDESCDTWKLYGIGQKFRKGKPLSSLFARSFVEVPGPPNKERSGHVKRSVTYRGWVQNKETNEWTQLNKMEGIQKGLTEQNRYIQDGQFVATMGGTRKKKYKNNKQVLKIPVNEGPLPLFIQKIDQLDMNIEFPEIIKYVYVRNRIKFRISIPGKRRKCTIILFCGMTDGLTIESMWDFSHKIEKYSSKKFVAFEKPEIPWKYARLFIRDNTMQIWSEHTFVI